MKINLYTIGFTQKSAENFFELIKSNNIKLLLDIRLNNKSQLAGFTKGDDLKYFLDKICNCEYSHCIDYAPSKEILDNYRKQIISWVDYEKQYNLLMTERKAVKDFFRRFGKSENICLLCSEPTPEHCHRRLFAEMISRNGENIKIIHI